MKFPRPIQYLLLLASVQSGWPGQTTFAAQQPQTVQEISSTDEARGAFIKNRNNAAGAASKAAKSGPRPTAGKNQKPSRPRPSAISPLEVSDPTSAPAPVRIGIGFTLYQRNERGEAIRVHPEKTFRKDDAVRFVIESNLAGYLYIFHSEGEAEPVMIFPDHRLQQGHNRINAHVPYEVPSRHSTTPWFMFDENPAVENLSIVLTKMPLAGVPTGDDLVKYCLPFGEDCNWKPMKPQYDLVSREIEQPKLVSLSKSLGQLQAAIEEVAIAKGIKLKSEEPEPTIVQMNVSPALDILAMKARLIHR